MGEYARINPNSSHLYKGELTARQTAVLAGMAAGHNQTQIAESLCISRGYVSANLAAAAYKLRSETSWGAVAAWGRAETYRSVAKSLREVMVAAPLDDAEQHVNHVLRGLAELYDQQAAEILNPKQRTAQ